MGITAEQIKGHGLIDEVIKEPLGGAHRHPDDMAERLKEALVGQIDHLSAQPLDQLLDDRYQRLMAMGSFDEG
jgi:acetyl-CoA carboxylase carboxyl transferase subunit alpha